MEPETPGSVLPPTRWNLTAPESLALLNGASTSGAEAFKLGLTELLARGALQLDSVSQGSFFRREVAMLRDGARAATPRERALEGIWNIYQRTPSRSYGDGQQGVRVEDLARSAARAYGSLHRYVTREVLPALVERGLYERQDGRFLWIFPTTRWALTAEGEAARSELQRLLAQGEQSVGGWADDDPSGVMAYATIAGAALLLQPALFPQLQRARLQGGTFDSGMDLSDVGGVDASGLDFSALDFSAIDFGSFDAAFSAIDSALSSFDSGGSSSDSGGGGDGGGSSTD